MQKERQENSGCVKNQLYQCIMVFLCMCGITKNEKYISDLKTELNKPSKKFLEDQNKTFRELVRNAKQMTRRPSQQQTDLDRDDIAPLTKIKIFKTEMIVI